MPCFQKFVSGAVVGIAAVLGTGVAPGGSAIQLLEEGAGDRTEQRATHLDRLVATGLSEARDDFRFRHFADLFFIDDHEPPSGIATNITAAIFGQGETAPGSFVFGSPAGSEPLGPLTAGGLPGSRSASPPTGSGTIGTPPLVNSGAPGGGAAALGGGGGGGGGGSPPAASPGSHGGQAGGGGSSNYAQTGEPNDGKFIHFSENFPGENHGPCCCCCGVFFNNGSFSNDRTQQGPSGHDGIAGEERPSTVAIPLPPSLWLGLVGLVAVGWLRRRHVRMC